MSKTAFSTPFLTMAFLVACGADPKPPPAAPSGDVTAPAEQARAEPKANDEPSRSQISISDEIKKACGLSDDETHFSFDSAQIHGRDHQVLAKVAKCFESGPLKGREMKLVGHADPRGEAEYNLTLGGRRADSVKAYVESQGLANGQIQTTSRGALDATGIDETGWAKDRRVDILVAN